jgi:hypothetical protein
VVLPNSLLSVPRMRTSSARPKSAFSVVHTSATQTSPKLWNAKLSRGMCQMGVCPPFALNVRGISSAMCTSFQMTAPLPRGTALRNGAQRLPRLNSSSVVRSLMTKILPIPHSSLQCSQPQTLPSRLRVTSSVAANTSRFYPLRFAFCENLQTALPLIALQYHDVELRITWGSAAATDKWDVYANYVYLDTQEREFFASNPQNMIITQVQKATASATKIQELNFNHPVKYLAAGKASALEILNDDNKLKLQINGTDVADFKFADPNFSHVPLYFNTTNSAKPATLKTLFVYPFCLETGKLQPTGTLNFSRLDSARIVNDTRDCDDDIYAVNYNILRIENGMGGLLYSN